jgi:hypothetical protein
MLAPSDIEQMKKCNPNPTFNHVFIEIISEEVDGLLKQ